MLVDACPEGNVGDVLLVGDAERLASLVWVAGRVGPELSEGVGSSVCARLVSRVAFGVHRLINSEDDVAVFERGGGCVDRALEGGRDVADDDGSLSLAFINPCVGLAAVGRVPDDGVVPLVGGEEAIWADEVADSVGVDMVGPFLGKGSVEADREAVVAPERGSPMDSWVRSVVSWETWSSWKDWKQARMKVQVSGRWSMRLLCPSRDCESRMPRPRGVSSCRIQWSRTSFHGARRGSRYLITHWAWNALMWDLRCMMLPPPSFCGR